MRAIILVGGLGTRLRPLTYTRPKPLLPALDRPILEWTIDRLRSAGVDEVVLSLGYLPDAFTAAYPDGTCAGVRLVYAVEPEPLDTAGAVRFAAREVGIDDGTESFLVLNGDVLSDIDVPALLAMHERVGAEATIALTRVDDPSRFGVVPIDDNGRVLDFIEKPEPGTAPTNWINAGIYALRPSVVGRIPDGRRVSIERETFPAIAADRALFAVEDASYWIDTGTPRTYVDAQLHLAQVDNAPGARGYVGPGAEIAPGAEVTASIVMAGARIGTGCRLHQAVLLPDAVVGDNAVIEDSIVGAGATVGAGARLSGLTIVGDGFDVAADVELDGAKVPTDD